MGFRLRGAALITAVVMALILSLVVGAGVAYVGATARTNWSKTRSEAALLLAEAAINDEIALLNRRVGSPTLGNSSPPALASSGQPYVGRVFTIPNVPGTAWVSTSSDPAGTVAWTSASATMYIQATAMVQGSRRKVRIGGAGDMRISSFGLYGIFGAKEVVGDNQAAIGLTGNANIAVTGGVGTNGVVQGGSGFIDFDFADNYNTAVTSGNQFDNGSPNTNDPVTNTPDPLRFSTVTNVLRAAFPQAGTDPWPWLALNNTNDRIRVYQSSLPSRTPSGTKLGGFTRDQNVLNGKNSNLSGSSLLLRIPQSDNGGSRYGIGSWSGVPLAPTGGKRTLIFPPGDYYLTGMEIDFNSGIEILVDDGGLTVGGNPNATPVRLWFNQPSGSSTNDYIEIPISYTSAPSPKIFRIYYNKGGCALEFARTSQAPSGPMIIFGGVYAMTGGSLSTQITFRGDTNNSNNRISLTGCLIADRVASQGYSSVIWSPDVINQLLDPPIRFGYNGGYVDAL